MNNKHSLNLMNRRIFLKNTSYILAAVAGAEFLPAAAPAAKPNIVLIHIDDLGWTDVTCFGSKYYETPHIDALARQGMKFTDAYAACAVCSPTRAALMTGRYPARLGLTDWIRARFQGGKGSIEAVKKLSPYVGSPNRKLLCPRNPFWMELGEITIAEALKPADYASCHIGKWHLGPTNWYPEKQGFDINIGGCDYGQPPSYFDPYFRKHQGYIYHLPSRKKGEYLTDREADEAVHFIRTHKDKPFFLYLAHYAVHTPLQAKKDLVNKYKQKPPTNQKNPTYAAMIESVDDSVHRVLQTLDNLNLTENTLVIFTSDNGGLWNYSTDNAPLRAGKGYPYEGGIRVPLIVRWPGVVQPGTVCHEPVISVDYFPTICQAAGVKLPADRTIDGESLMPLLTGTGHLHRKAIFWHFPHYRGRIVPYSIIREGDWKLIKRYEGKKYELFNLKKDISETTDLADTLPAVVQKLDKKLTTWLKYTHAKLPKPNPNYHPESQKK